MKNKDEILTRQTLINVNVVSGFWALVFVIVRLLGGVTSGSVNLLLILLVPYYFSTYMLYRKGEI